MEEKAQMARRQREQENAQAVDSGTAKETDSTEEIFTQQRDATV